MRVMMILTSRFLQGARGGRGSDWYISNVFEELDTPTEYYYDIAKQTLFYFGNGTHGTAPHNDVFVATTLHTLFNITGASQDAPLTGFSLRSIGLRDTAPTMLEPHGVPRCVSRDSDVGDLSLFPIANISRRVNVLVIAVSLRWSHTAEATGRWSASVPSSSRTQSMRRSHAAPSLVSVATA
eukprot:COSAG05_NODE_1072_length_5963_cov_9.550477_4_plen_182_part_00